jgi:hypothetical protein
LRRFFGIQDRDEKKVISYSDPMNLRKKASETFDSVVEASEKVVGTTELATVALVAVAALSLAGLAVALVALARTTPTREA